ncbi:MAG: hypothetical protein AABW83_04410 [Nanoarchaeota archaeon]
MGDVKSYFFDSYALIELFKGNKKYESYKTTKIVTSYFHLYEIYYSLLREHSESEFIYFFYFLQNFCIELKFNWIIKASKFKQEYKNRQLSYANCLGYIISRELNIKFLTGDKEFEDLPNVEFIKK